MNSGRYLSISAIFGFLGVGLGAFGAHALKDILITNSTYQIWQTAVLYHLTHSAVLLILAISLICQSNNLQKYHKYFRISFILLCVAIILFSGSLYILAITNIRILGVITPLGGIFFLVSWLILIMAGFKIKS